MAIATLTEEYGTSHWANAKLNGNYYVWIPRYAYKIDTSVTYTSQEGTSNKIDVKFIGTDVTSENVATKVGVGYTVHPAFTFGTVGETTTPNELAGIWVGKYESSDDGNGNVKIIPNVKSYTGIDVATMFTKSQALSTTNYDMSGGAFEYVMGFYGTAENTPTLGNTGFTASTIPERKYYDLYIKKTSADSSNIGDALYETKGWNRDIANFVYFGSPVFTRGGHYNYEYHAGAFSFGSDNGAEDGVNSFRVCLAVQ